MAQPEKTRKPSARARMLSARLSAAQALYQAWLNEQALSSVLEEFLEMRSGMEIEGESLVKPDGALLKKILLGVDGRLKELETLLAAQTKGQGKGMDMLLKSIMLCASYELLAHQDIDSPIIINDYLHVTHAFYEGGEAALVNGVLDSLAKTLR